MRFSKDDIRIVQSVRKIIDSISKDAPKAIKFEMAVKQVQDGVEDNARRTRIAEIARKGIFFSKKRNDGWRG